MNATDFLKAKGLIKEGYSQFVITHPDLGEIDLAKLLVQYVQPALIGLDNVLRQTKICDMDAICNSLLLDYGYSEQQNETLTPHRGQAQEMQNRNGFSDAEARGKESEDSAASGEG